MTGRLDTETIDRARAVQVADVIQHRRIPLRRIGLDLVGACPVCGDRGRAVAQTGSPFHLRKNAWLCRRCQLGGGVVDLVMSSRRRRLPGSGWRPRGRQTTLHRRPNDTAQSAAPPKLSDDADVTTGLVIGEALETAGMVFGFAPAWALGSARGIAKSRCSAVDTDDPRRDRR
jgi:hypothetical protein